MKPPHKLKAFLAAAHGFLFSRPAGDTSAGPEVQSIKYEGTFYLHPMIRLGDASGKALECKASDPILNPDLFEDFSL